MFRCALGACLLVPGCGSSGGPSLDPDLGAPSDAHVDVGAEDGGADQAQEQGPGDLCDGGATPFGGGSGSESDPFLVCSNAHFMALDADAAAHYRLTTDLDFTGVTYAPIADFRGVLDGGGHVARNITITPTASVGAPFDQLNGATVRDLRVEHLSVTHAGAAAGLALGVSVQIIPSGTRPSTVSNVHVTGSVTSAGTGNAASGLLGTFARGSVVGVSFEGTVTGYTASGAADWMQNSATLRQVRVDATLVASKDAAGLSRLAGGTVREAAVHGSATAGLHASGLLGAFPVSGVLEDAYSRMDLTLDFSFPVDTDANIVDHSYRAAGAVSEPRYGTFLRFARVYFAGSIIANNPPMGEETVTDGMLACWGGYTGCQGAWIGTGCYWDTETSGESAPGGGRTECVGLTSAALSEPANASELAAPVWSRMSGSPPRLTFELD